jgi:hypothetical protein
MSTTHRCAIVRLFTTLLLAIGGLIQAVCARAEDRSDDTQPRAILRLPRSDPGAALDAGNTGLLPPALLAAVMRYGSPKDIGVSQVWEMNEKGGLACFRSGIRMTRDRSGILVSFGGTF